MTLSESERLLVEDVLAVARDMRWTGRIEVQLRPGKTAEVFGIHRKVRREARPLRDDSTLQSWVETAVG